MSENFYLEHFKNSDETLFYELLAHEVTKNIAMQVAYDEKIIGEKQKREKLYRELEKLYDSTDDNFIKVVIGHAFATGIYPLPTVFTFNNVKLDIYNGCNDKRRGEFADESSKHALSIVNELIKKDNQFRLAIDLVENAIQAANKSNQSRIREKIYNWVRLIKFSDDIRKSIEKIEFLIPAIDYLIQKKEYRKTEILEVIDGILKFSIEQGDTADSVRSRFNNMHYDCIFPAAFELKLKYYQKVNDSKREKKTAKEFAEVYEELGDTRAKSGGESLGIAMQHYQEAIRIYDLYGFKEELQKGKRILEELRQQFIELHANELKTGISDSTDLKKFKELKEYLSQYKELDLDKQIINLIGMVKTFNNQQVQEFRKIVKESNPFSEVFTHVHFNQHYQKTFQNDTEENKISYAVNEMITYQMIIIEPFLKILIEKINENNLFLDLSQIILNQPVLKKRKNVFTEALAFFFQGKFYVALHILIPQIEWWFRELVYEAGGQISYLKKIGDNEIEEAKTLKAILETEELKNILGLDVVWFFEQLLTKEPMNLRNKTAHGLDISDEGYALYFILYLIRVFIKQNEKSHLSSSD